MTWDQGKEMALHAEISRAAGLPAIFCERASPWQPRSNENTVRPALADDGPPHYGPGGAARSWTR